MEERVARFLRVVDWEVLRLGVRERLAVQQMLLCGGFTDQAALRAALCALLARNRDDGVAIGRRFDACFAEVEVPAPVAVRRRRSWGLLLLVPVLVLTPRGTWTPVRREVIEPPAVEERPLERWPAFLIKPRMERAAAVEREQCVTAEMLSVRIEQPPKIVYTMEPAEPARPIAWQEPAPPGPAPDLPEGWLTASLLLGALALRLLLAPAERRLGQRKVDEVARERVVRAEADREETRHPIYNIGTVWPVPLAKVDEAAGLLGRVFRRERGKDLDVPATLQATLRAAGRFEPRYLPGQSPRGLLVLIDREGGDWPYLARLERMVARWQRQGLRVRRLWFRYYPVALWDKQGRTWTLDQLGWQEPGAALLIISRLQGQGREDWAAELAPWSLRAWLDPWLREDGDEQAWRLGTLRFPMSGEGVVALARYFAAEGVGVRPPRQGEVPADALALRQWAAVAALVPDPGWDQAEALRRDLPWLVAALPDPRALQRLVETLGEAANGLVISEEQERELVRWLRSAGLEQEGRALILRQLGDTAPPGSSPLARALWGFKRRFHEAILTGLGMAELRQDLENPAVAEVAWRMIGDELQRQEEAGGIRWQGLGVEEVITLRQLVGWQRWGWVYLGTVALGLYQAGLVWQGRHSEPQQRLVEAQAPQGWLVKEGRIAVPAEVLPFRVQQRIEASVYRPALRRIPARGSGCAFLMATTEVTQGQYRRVMGKNPAMGCASGTVGDRYPAICVSWYDAVDYANRLSQQEKLTPCYERRVEDVQWKARFSCTGYRLPTSEEWEYAALAGKKTEYAGSNVLENVTWIDRKLHEVAGKKPNAWGLFDMTGNVWEWVWDRNGRDRLYRGGSWVYAPPVILRVAERGDGDVPMFRLALLGFRLARSYP